MATCKYFLSNTSLTVKEHDHITLDYVNIILNKQIRISRNMKNLLTMLQNRNIYLPKKLEDLEC